jgi:tRNA threonylcarbamoyl adenosine modification protein YeaZ
LAPDQKNVNNERKRDLILAIETAVLGGSISLLRDGAEIASISGGKDISRSEDLLVNITDILRKSDAGPRDIELIAVSTGPGSYTGIRVGIATALGLKNSLNIECVGVEVLRSMKMAANGEEQIICAVPIGRDEVCWQAFNGSTAEAIRVEKQGEFANRVLKHEDIKVIVHEKLFASIAASVETPRIRNAGGDLARYIGMAALDREALSKLEPIYIRDNF